MSLELQLVLLLWGTVVGVDLVSVPQMMIARPLVAGTVAGAIVGDLAVGLAIGTIFELFQYDILPVGAARYPEYGPATIAAVSAAHFTPGALSLGLGVLTGLATAVLGGVSLHWLRRANARAVRAATAALETGDARVLIRVHVGSIARDGLRAAIVTALGLALAWGARVALAGTLTVRGIMLLGAVAGGAALAAGASGMMRLVGRGPNLAWLAAGLAGGAAVAWLH